MICGIGIDIVENQRIAKSLKKYQNIFLAKFLTELEIKKLRTPYKLEHICGIFAAKEATIKATAILFSKPLSFMDICISKNGDIPQAKILRRRLKNRRIYLSISHENKHSIAVAICETKLI